MSARRTMTSTKIRNAVSGMKFYEKLEERTMLTTVITDTNPLTATPATFTFEYKDRSGSPVRVSVHGDVSAEFVFGRITDDSDLKKNGTPVNQLILGDHVEPQAFDKDGKLVANPEDGRDLFHVYVAQATLESFISIAQVPAPNDTGDPRPMLPFGAPQPIRADNLNATNVRLRTLPGGTGGIYLGAKTVNTQAVADVNEPDRPIIVSNRFHGIGLMPPNSQDRLIAGFSTAPGVTLGRFLFGGTVTGSVIIQGSMETFYCGNLLTGAAQGQFEGVSEAPGNFYVAGDIRNILVKGAVGTDVVPHAFNDRLRPAYLTGTDFNVKGKVGQIRVGGDYAGTGTVYNTNDGNGLRVRQSELEIRIDPTLNRGSFTDFEIGAFGDGDAFFTNDSFEGAQFLGSINSKQTGENSIQLNGVWQHLVRVNDLGDFYAVGLMAGQQVTVRLIANDIFSTPEAPFKSVLHAGVFDPDRRLIASDFTNAFAQTNIPPGTISGGDEDVTTATAGNFDPVKQEHFTFTAEKPGIYYFAVGQSGPTFNGGSLFTEQPYQLQITGVGKIGLGGLVVDDTIFGNGGFPSPRKESSTGYDGNIEVVLGDIGAVISHTDFIVSGTLDQFNVLAIGGNIRAIEAVSMGEVDGDPNGPDGSVLNGGALIGALTGSVGMIRTTGTNRAANAMLVNDIGRFTNQAAFVPPTRIGGDIQYIVSPTTLITDLAANGNVGVVQTANFGVTNYAGSISANADGIGKPGVIDLIDVTGDLGTLQAGGPIISTGPGGNVRYIHISPTSTAFRPRLFGGSEPEETTYVQGQEASITDDSGAQVRITPTLEDQLDPTTGAPVLDPITLEPLNNSGSLTVLTYPIARSVNSRGGGGSAIVRITSTRGVEIRATGGSVEIGDIHSTDANAPGLVQGVGPDGIANTGDEDPGPDGIVGTPDDPIEIDPAFDNFGQFPDNSVLLRSDADNHPVDAFMIRGTLPAGRVHFNEIRNTTTGEIVNIDVGQIALLEAQSLGIAHSRVQTNLPVDKQTSLDLIGTSGVDGDTYPFNAAKNGIIINGTGVESDPAVALLRSREQIGHVLISGRADEIFANYDGVNVKGLTEGINGNIFAEGELRLIRIGEGVLPSGTGNLSEAGIYCIVDDDLRGTEGMGRIEKVIGEYNGADIRGDIMSNVGIGDIELHGGSIVNNEIQVRRTIDTGSDRTGLDVQSQEFGSGRRVITQGTAGGRALGNIDNITVDGFGGIIGLWTESANLGPIRSTAGFGVINSFFDILGNGRFADNTADGYGFRGVSWVGGQSIDSVLARGDGRRLTTTSFEPSMRFSEVVKIDPYFGTRPNVLTDLHQVIGTTKEAPQRKGTSSSGSIDLSAIQVSRDAGTIHGVTMRLNLFNIANNISAIITDSYMDSVRLTAGRVDMIAIGGDGLRNDLTVAGPVGDVYVRTNWRGSSKLFAEGDGGSIRSINVKGSLFGDFYAQDGIGKIAVGRAYGSMGTRSATNMTEFSVKGDFLTGAILTVEKNLNNNAPAGARLDRLSIGGDLQDGALIRVGTLGEKVILGQELGVIDTKPWET